MTTDKLQILEKFTFFAGLPPLLRREVRGAAQFAALEPGTYFYHEGDEQQHLALVSRGDIRVFKTGESGREITLYHVRDGQTCLVNMVCIFTGQRAMASAIAESPVEALVLPAAAAREWVRHSDPLRNFVFETISRRLIDVMALVEEIALRKMDCRLAGYLLQRFARLRVIDVTHEEIAAELGTAREVVSRLLKLLERAGAIQLNRGHIQLRDEPLLASLAAGTAAREKRRSVTKLRKTTRKHL